MFQSGGKTNGRKDTKKVIVSFSKFATAYKNHYNYCKNKISLASATTWNVQHAAEYEDLLNFFAQITNFVLHGHRKTHHFL